MEDLIVAVLMSFTAISTVIPGLYVGQKLTPKNRIMSSVVKDYEDIIDRLRAENRKWLAKAKYFEKGHIPASAGREESPEGVIEAVLNALPDNFKSMIMPFKAQILQHAKENPEIAQSVIEVVKARILSPHKGEENAIQNDVL